MRPPRREPPALLRTLRCSALHVGTGFDSACIDWASADLYGRRRRWTDYFNRPGYGRERERPLFRLRLGSCGSGGRLGRRGLHGDVTALGRPFGLHVDARHPHPAPLAPRTGDLARRAAEVRDHLAAAPAGHTLPQPMGLLGLILAVALVAGHEPLRLAFPA